MPATIDAYLRAGAARLSASPTPLLDARVLMKFATGLDDAGLIARGDAAPTQEQQRTFDEAIARRAKGEPVAYVTGVTEFWSLAFQVSPDVLIPRADSECLIEAALARRTTHEVRSILDLGTGSGCLLCALLCEFSGAFGVGVDISPAAAKIAAVNARRLGLAARAAFLAGNWAAALGGPYDIVIANPPYIRTGDPALSPEVGRFEPAAALFAGPDGLEACRAILADAPRLVAPGGLAVFECGSDQAGALAEMLARAFPKAETTVVNDLKGRPRGVLADEKRTAKKD